MKDCEGQIEELCLRENPDNVLVFKFHVHKGTPGAGKLKESTHVHAEISRMSPCILLSPLYRRLYICTKVQYEHTDKKWAKLASKRCWPYPAMVKPNLQSIPASA